MDLLAFEATKASFDRGAPRWKEALWGLVRILFFLSPWPWPSAFKASLLRLFGARVGRGVVIRPRVQISFPWRLEIGDHSWLGEEVLLLNLAPVRIGSHCCLSQRAFLCTGSHDFHAAAFPLVTAPIQILDRSWIAAGCFVAPGITFGPDAMAAAGSVVTRDVAPLTIVAGNPARVNGELRTDPDATFSQPA
ncbi:MAG: WcaF family extracellular polysaccharide biosynthesis acetyltransferase [Verrucomicrobia bacterium]|nr:WcaF family extracellular polysaccharide biosynthesis acetyltransferase [Verrucomicrobiota bacterium]